MKSRRIISFILSALMVLCLFPALEPAADSAEITIMFTHDIHDYLYPTTTVNEGKTLYHGGAAKLATVIKENAGPNTVFLDGGDFSMGTLYQTIYTTDAVELRNLGLTGCDVTTFGNHDFDYGAKQVAQMLRKAKASGDPLPAIVQSNIDFSGELTADQKDLKAAFDELNVKEYTVLNCGGYKLGIFGLVGLNAIDCIQTDLSYINYIEAAKSTVNKLKNEKCDIIIALSHAGTKSETEGEDTELARSVPDIDIIISAHSHSTFKEPVYVGDTLIASCGEYLNYVGKINLSVKNGKPDIGSYSLIPLDNTVADDPEAAARIDGYKTLINENYLASYGVSFDDVVAYSKYNFIGLDEMYATHQEFNMGNIIADAYMYEAKKCGITDIDVALVGLGTIRGSIKRGNITAADIFEICSLGVGGDDTPGHPIVTGYVTGKELKLLVELDASLGTSVSSIKMSYNGLKMKFNTKRIILDRVTEVALVRENKKTEEIEDDKLYKVAANMYAINMLGMVNDLTKGILKIVPKNAQGEVIEDLYTASMRDSEGNEVKEWIALKDYLSSLPAGNSGYPEIPDDYATAMGRKVKVSEGGFAAISKPGTATKIVPIALSVAAGVFIILVALIIIIVKTARKRRKAKMIGNIREIRKKKRLHKEKEETRRRRHKELYAPAEKTGPEQTEETAESSDEDNTENAEPEAEESPAQEQQNTEE